MNKKNAFDFFNNINNDNKRMSELCHFLLQKQFNI